MRLGRAGAPAPGVRIRTDERGEVLARDDVMSEGDRARPGATKLRDELAGTATGKLLKSKLRAPYREGRDRQVG